MRLIIKRSGERYIDGEIPEYYQDVYNQKIKRVREKCARLKSLEVDSIAFNNYFNNLNYGVYFESVERDALDLLGISETVTIPLVNGVSLNLINSDIEDYLLSNGFYVSNYQKTQSVLIQHFSENVSEDSDFKKKVLIQPMDGTQISPYHIRIINSYDIIITPSKVGKELMLLSGIYKPIVVIPNYYSEDIPSSWFDKKSLASNKFTFYSESTGIKRKNIDNLLLYFLKTFTADDNVRLIIKTSSDRTDNINKIISEFKNRAEVVILSEYISQPDVLSIMNNIDCYICLSYMEGFCIPIINALRLNKKIIALDSQISGYADFLNNDNSFLVKCNQVPIDTLHESLLIWDNTSVWEEADYQDYQNILKRVLIEKKNIITDLSEYSKESVMKKYHTLISDLVDSTTNISCLTNYHYSKKIRLGNEFDGGYVIADTDGYDCYISAGIGGDESFSTEFMDKYNMNSTNSYAFDSTIENLPLNFPPSLNYIPKNISSINDSLHTDLSYILNDYTNVFLKMDIEGGEIEWFSTIGSTQLANIKQMVVEFHDIRENKTVILKILQTLSKTHYLIHVHGNNYTELLEGRPDVIELTYLRRTNTSESLLFNRMTLPSSLDFPNNINLLDIDLEYGHLDFIDFI